MKMEKYAMMNMTLGNITLPFYYRPINIFLYFRQQTALLNTVKVDVFPLQGSVQN